LLTVRGTGYRLVPEPVAVPDDAPEAGA